MFQPLNLLGQIVDIFEVLEQGDLRDHILILGNMPSKTAIYLGLTAGRELYLMSEIVSRINNNSAHWVDAVDTGRLRQKGMLGRVNLTRSTAQPHTL